MNIFTPPQECKNLFIDTNIFLDFYHFSKADLEELNKLVALLSSGQIKLFIPQQLRDEFNRNRDNKINATFPHFRGHKFAYNFPIYCKDYPEYKQLQKLLTQIEEKHSALTTKLTEDINNKNLQADIVIKQLFKKAIPIQTNDKIFSRHSVDSISAIHQERKR